MRLIQAKLNIVNILAARSGDLRLAWDTVDDSADRLAATLGVLSVLPDDIEQTDLNMVNGLFDRLIKKEEQLHRQRADAK